MKTFNVVMITLAVLFTINHVDAQTELSPDPQKIAVLEFQALGIDNISLLTSVALLREEVGILSDMEVVTPQTEASINESVCSNALCALEIGQELNVDQVVFGSLNMLGEKVIVQYSLVDIASKSVLLQDHATSVNIEDLEMIMKRVALSIVAQKPLAETAMVGTIIASETITPRRRSARKITGFSFGYLYPMNGYDNVDQSLTFDFQFGYELDQMAVGLKLGIRRGFATNVFGSYLLTKTDFCPYIGAGFGIHWIAHDDETDWNHENNKRTHGAEISLHGGVKAFRTYNFQIIFNVDYSYTFNDYDDRGIAVTIGILSSKKRRH